MKASKFTDAQKAFILKQEADGHPVAEICHDERTSYRLAMTSQLGQMQK